MGEVCSSTFISSTKQLLFIFIEEVISTIFLCFGAVVYSFIQYSYLGLIYCIIGSIFVSALSLCIGTVTKKTNMFELWYIFIWLYN